MPADFGTPLPHAIHRHGPRPARLAIFHRVAVSCVKHRGYWFAPIECAGVTRMDCPGPGSGRSVVASGHQRIPALLLIPFEPRQARIAGNRDRESTHSREWRSVCVQSLETLRGPTRHSVRIRYECRVSFLRSRPDACPRRRRRRLPSGSHPHLGSTRVGVDSHSTLPGDSGPVEHVGLLRCGLAEGVSAVDTWTSASPRCGGYNYRFVNGSWYRRGRLSGMLDDSRREALIQQGPRAPPASS